MKTHVAPSFPAPAFPTTSVKKLTPIEISVKSGGAASSVGERDPRNSICDATTRTIRCQRANVHNYQSCLVSRREQPEQAGPGLEPTIGLKAVARRFWIAQPNNASASQKEITGWP